MTPIWGGFRVGLVPAIMLLTLGVSFGQSFYELKIGSYPGIMRQERGVNPGIATGSHVGYYVRFGEDISLLCSRYGIPITQSVEGYRKNPKFRVNVFATQGSFESLKRLRKEDEVQLAIVQSDLYTYAKEHGTVSYLERVYPGPIGPQERRIADSWNEIAEKIQLLMPLFTEKIHIVVRPGETRYEDLLSLFQKRARVNVGSLGSGTMVTCSLLEEAITAQDPSLRWKKNYMSSGAALDRLLDGSENDEEGLDAVIFVGAEPFPALERFTLNLIQSSTKRRGNLYLELFGKDSTEVRTKMKLLPTGRAEKYVDLNRAGYVRTEIEGYQLLRGEGQKPESPIGLTACLVTHRVKTETPGDEKHKSDWDRH
ncbi:MAG: hypothetical protein AAGJ31_07870, partial [Verrucomicrobiota bacterium]